MKTPQLVVPDIYKMLEDSQNDLSHGKMEEIIHDFGEACKEALRAAVTPQPERPKLSLSAVGKPARKLWQAFWGIKAADLKGPTYIKFLYGHITECLVLALAQLAGHKVTEQQKVCEVEGVQGHQDCRLDGLLIDVKSASSYGFKKFKYNTLHLDDSWGYIPQLKAYAHQERDTQYGWLAMDKSTGELALLVYDETDKSARYAKAIDYDIAEKVREVKKILEGPLPSLCYDDIPDGKSGNRKLQSGCAYCDFRETCWPQAVAYGYSTGPKYLTVIAKDPRVPLDNSDPEGF